jgi:hypothetical protein
MAIQPLSGVGSIGPASSSGVVPGGGSWSALQQEFLLPETQGTQGPESLEKAVEEIAVQEIPGPSGSSVSSKSAPLSEAAKFLSSPLVANLLGSDVLPPGLIQPMFQHDVSLGELMVVGHEVALHATYVGLASKISDSTQKAVTQLAQASG